jgi:hypothetical protein
VHIETNQITSYKIKPNLQLNISRNADEQPAREAEDDWHRDSLGVA